MMSGPRSYSTSTRAALAWLSKGRCYFPDCETPIFKFISDDEKGIAQEPVLDYEIAHIRDANLGNRYEPNMTDDERRSFSNLLLLCKPHHKWVDKTHPGKYSVNDLEKWKLRHEGADTLRLAGIGSMSKAELDLALMRAREDEQDDQVAYEQAMFDLGATDLEDIDALTTALGAAVASIPNNDEDGCIDFLKRLQKLSWVRKDWINAQEYILFSLRSIIGIIDRWDPVIDAFKNAISENRGFKSVHSFMGYSSLRRVFEVEGMENAYMSEIRRSLCRTIRDRAIAHTLLSLLIGPVGSPGSPNIGNVRNLETRWALTDGDAIGEKFREFEIFTSQQDLVFRVTVSPRTIDLFGVREGHSIVLPSFLRAELLDEMAWWLVLVPAAARRLVYDAYVAKSYGRNPNQVLDRVAILATFKDFSVGLA